MKVGFSLSPGGLLLPYHLGVMDGLRQNRVFTDQSPIAGSSAGAICAASVACGLDLKRVLDATVDISDATRQMGGARGRLLPLLRSKLTEFIDEEAFEMARERDGALVIAYRELFPANRPVHQTAFESRDDLSDAVCHSSMCKSQSSAHCLLGLLYSTRSLILARIRSSIFCNQLAFHLSAIEVLCTSRPCGWLLCRPTESLWMPRFWSRQCTSGSYGLCFCLSERNDWA
jgi:hypothetical protein